MAAIESTRQKKFARTLQKELAVILQREIDPIIGGMVTVSIVRASADLQNARVYVTCLPDTKIRETVMLLNENRTHLRQLLARSVGNIFRVMPNLDFYEDDTPRTAQRLEELFTKLQPAPVDMPAEADENNNN